VESSAAGHEIGCDIPDRPRQHVAGPLALDGIRDVR
jgi:hypothetical protein